MKCPRTGSTLTVVKVGGIEVEVSQACGGIFFDNLELSKFNSKTQVRGEALAKHVRQFNTHLLDENERIKCPKCIDTVMMRRYYSLLNVVEIDECPGCGGIWLDTGELDKIHNNELSDAELARLRMNLIDQTTSPNINVTPKYQLNSISKGNSLDAVFEIVTAIFD